MPADPYPMACCYRERLAFQLYSTFCEPKLFRMVTSGDLQDLQSIPARCASHPKEAGFVHRYAPNDAAIHRLLRQCHRPAASSAASSSSRTTNAAVSSPSKSHASCSSSSCAIKASGSARSGADAGSGIDHATDNTESSDVEEDRELHATLQAIEALLRANRQAAALADGFGRTPLHLACMSSDTPCGVEATRVLLSHFSSEGSRHQQIEGSQLSAVLTRKDVEGRTPLHWLLLRSDKIPMDVLDAMLDACPQLVSVKDEVRETVGDICRRRQSSIANHRAVLERIDQVANSLASPPSPMEPSISAKGPQRRLVGLKDME